MRIYFQKIGTSLSTCMLRNGEWWSIRHQFPGSIHNSKSGPTLNHEWPFWFPCFTNWKVSYLTGVNLDRSDTEVFVAYSLPKSTHQKCEETTWTMDRTPEFQETSINFSGVWQGVLLLDVLSRCSYALMKQSLYVQLKVWLLQRKCGVLVVGRKKTCCKLLSIRALCCNWNSTGVGHDCPVFS